MANPPFEQPMENTLFCVVRINYLERRQEAKIKYRLCIIILQKNTFI